MAGKKEPPAFQADDYTASVVRKQKVMSAATQLALSFVSTVGLELLTFRVVLPTSINLILIITHGYVQRSVSMVTLNPLKFRINISSHLGHLYMHILPKNYII